MRWNVEHSSSVFLLLTLRPGTGRHGSRIELHRRFLGPCCGHAFAKHQVNQPLRRSDVMSRLLQRGEDLTHIDGGFEPLQEQALAGGLWPHQNSEIAELDSCFLDLREVPYVQDRHTPSILSWALARRLHCPVDQYRTPLEQHPSAMECSGQRQPAAFTHPLRSVVKRRRVRRQQPRCQILKRFTRMDASRQDLGLSFRPFRRPP